MKKHLFHLHINIPIKYEQSMNKLLSKGKSYKMNKKSKNILCKIHKKLAGIWAFGCYGCQKIKKMVE